jgi:arylsulfatase A-like enzyme
MRKAVAAAAALLIAAACTGGGAEEKPEPQAEQPTKAPVQGRVEIASPEPVTQAPDGWFEAACDLPLEQLKRVRRGYVPGRSPELIVVPREPNYFGSFASYTHSGPWDYVQSIPLVFYGPGFIAPQGEITLDRETTIADLAPTLAELLDTPFPGGRPGKAVTEALLPEEERNGIPKVIVTVVWDGGGWNVLDAWPDSWPYLRKLMEEGTSVANAEVGSSPSVTPAVHTNLGTGAFPKQHGIVDIPVREGVEIFGAYDGFTPRFLQIPTLADLYDRRTGNAAKIGMFAYKPWHLGMIGHGSYVPGGDKDIAFISEKFAGELKTNPEYYSLPPYLEEVEGFEEDVRKVDLDDGKIDDHWMGHEVLNDPNKLRHTPVWALYQTRLLKAVLEGEGFGGDDVADLFFINYKQVDDVGHDWNMLNPEMREILEYSDDELRKITRFLDDLVGEEQWVMAFTADHGQGPDPLTVGAWPIGQALIEEDIAREFDVDTSELFQDRRPVGWWIHPEVSAETGVTAEDLADFLVSYRLKDNKRPDADIPPEYSGMEDSLLFSAAFPSEALPRIWHCAKKKA